MSAMREFFQSRALFRFSSWRLSPFSPQRAIFFPMNASTLQPHVVWDAPVNRHTPTRRRTIRLDGLLMKCNFVIWFVNLGILLPRALS
jgi:hypothetical protein